MLYSRILAVIIVLGATLWIGSGVLSGAGAPTEDAAVQRPAEEAQPAFRVAVIPALTQSHSSRLSLSGHTEADERASAVARTTGSIVELLVRRGDQVAVGDVVARLSDEARDAQVAQAEALVQQRQADLDAKLQLIGRGVLPANTQNQLEADLSAAQAALAQARAEQERGTVRAPISGVVSEVPLTTGQTVASGDEVARIIALNPMLAVAEVAERQLGDIRVGDAAVVQLVTGTSVEGTVRFVSPTATSGTRTYRVEVELDNVDGTIADGITAQVDFRRQAVDAVPIPRSALTISEAGQISVRTVDAEGIVASVPVTIVEDTRDVLWVSGPAPGTRIIVQGQDFVKDGHHVEAVEVPASAIAESTTS
jgi:multidrug efflux system membrane fusion protein